jgi:hypothetical protein
MSPTIYIFSRDPGPALRRSGSIIRSLQSTGSPGGAVTLTSCIEVIHSLLNVTARKTGMGGLMRRERGHDLCHVGQESVLS